jgi:hypothetical protein
MEVPHMRNANAIILMTGLMLTATMASAWTLRLDIDTDSDPSTLNLSTNDESAEISLHLWPDASGEPISEIQFGLGVSCTQCGPPEEAGMLVDCELLATSQDWMDHPAFQTTWHDVATCIDCCDEAIGFWLGDFFGAAADPAFEPFVPVTLVRFQSTAIGGPGPHCPAMHKRVAVFVDGDRHEVIIDADGVIPNVQFTWSVVKALYR